MRFIEKGVEPVEFIEWKAEEEEQLEKWYEDDNISGDTIFSHLMNAPKDDRRVIFHKGLLKECLVKEQGYICCYCGGRILKDHNTRIEHLEDKGTNKRLTFEYSNLLASCQGGTKPIIHVVKEGEKLPEIAKLYGVTIGILESLNVTKENIGLLQEETKFEVKIGDKLLIIPQVKGRKRQHCDNHKGGEPITVTPLQENCETRFRYDLQTGEIKEKDEKDTDAFQTIKVLGLNNNTDLKRRRLKLIEQAGSLIQTIFQNPEIDHVETIQGLIGKYEEQENDMFQPYFFVATNILNGN